MADTGPGAGGNGGAGFEASVRACPHCGVDSTRDVCQACGHRAHGMGLRLLSGAAAEGPTPPPPPVRIRRELKLPSVEALLEAERDLSRLPERLLGLHEALCRDDFAEADRRLEQAMATVLPGPGYRSQRWLLLAVLCLWVACSIALGVLVLLDV